MQRWTAKYHRELQRAIPSECHNDFVQEREAVIYADEELYVDDQVPQLSTDAVA